MKEGTKIGISYRRKIAFVKNMGIFKANLKKISNFFIRFIILMKNLKKTAIWWLMRVDMSKKKYLMEMGIFKANLIKKLAKAQ